MIALGLLILFMAWAYRRGKKLELKVALLREQERKDHEILRAALLHRMQAEWEIKKLDERLNEVLRQQNEDIKNLMLSATDDDQVQYLQQVYGDEEENE